MSRRLCLLLIPAALALGGDARADAPAGAGTLTFVQRFFNPDSGLFEVINSDQVYKHMNRATCLCAEQMPDNELFQMGVFQQLTGVTTPSQLAMETWVGQSCDMSTARQAPPGGATCENIATAGLSHFEDIDIKRGFLAQIPTDRLIEPYAKGCAPSAGSNSVYDLLVDGANLDVAGTASYSFDTQAPDLPTDFNAVGGENAIQIDFTPPADTTDIFYYQALCATTDGKVAITSTPDPAQYDVTRYKTGCELDQDDVNLQPSPVTGTAVPDAMPSDGGPIDAFDDLDAGVPDAMPDAMPDAGVPPFSCPPDLPAPLCHLDPAYVCKTITSGNSMRIEGLANGVGYRVVVLAIDRSGNASGVYLTNVLVPQPVTDFWEDIHDNGSDVESGFCLISDTYGDGGPITNAMRGFRDDNLGSSTIGRALTRFYYAHVAWLGEYARAYWPVRIVLAVLLAPFVLLALAWHVLTLPGLIALIGLAWWMRRRRRGRSARVATAATVTLMLLAITGRAAHAQDDPWNEPDATDDTTDEGDIGVVEPHWIVGIKLGPYVPGIDAQFHAQADPALASYYPYHHMFGGYNVMPVLEVDRVLLERYGQLTVGGSLGYLGKSGNTYVDGSTYANPDRPTATDTNSFHMIPLAIELGYRFTFLDDEWGIPVVPYAKGGLAYDLWWMRDPNGDFSHVGPGNCHPEPATGDCMQTAERAVGGSMGLIGAIGIAIRAERIDPSAAASMREGGIEHAGFYAELQSAWVDSFGNANRLSLGESTWFAGVNFEF